MALKEQVIVVLILVGTFKPEPSINLLKESATREHSFTMSTSQMAPSSLKRALLLTKAHKALVKSSALYSIGYRMQFGMQTLCSLTEVSIHHSGEMLMCVCYC